MNEEIFEITNSDDTDHTVISAGDDESETIAFPQNIRNDVQKGEACRFFKKHSLGIIRPIN